MAEAVGAAGGVSLFGKEFVVASSLAPSLLLSMPQLVDPNFTRTVVLLCQHDEDGAFGLVVNRPVMASGRIVVTLDPPVDEERALELWVGGPVEPQRSWMLVGDAAREDGLTDGVRIADGLHLSTSPGLLRRLLEPDPPPRTRLIVGYSGWGPGQLEAELEVSAWLTAGVDSNLIFGTPPERMWEAAIRSLGVDPSALHASRGVH